MKEKNTTYRNKQIKETPQELEKMLAEFKKRKIFNLVKGVIAGKPMYEKYYDEYKGVYKKLFSDLDTPVLFNVNFGHPVPRCVIPYGIETKVDYGNKKIVIDEPMLAEKTFKKIK